MAIKSLRCATIAAAPDCARALAAGLELRRNDLTTAAVAVVPAVAEILAALAAAPGVLLTRMSGSGATCFGLCEDLAAARAAAAWLEERRSGWWITAAGVGAGVPGGHGDDAAAGV